MSFSFLLFVLENFSKEPLKVEFNHVMSPKYIPDDVLAKFPPCRFITGGLDPLRDESIRLMVRLLKVGVVTRRNYPPGGGYFLRIHNS